MLIHCKIPFSWELDTLLRARKHFFKCCNTTSVNIYRIIVKYYCHSVGKYKLNKYVYYVQGFPVGSDGKESACICRRPGFHPWVRKIPWRKEWQPTPTFLPRESHWQRSLVGYGPWGRRVGHTLWLILLPYMYRVDLTLRNKSVRR